MKKRIPILLCCTCLLLSGCSGGVSQEEYDALVAENESLEEQLDTLRTAHDNLLIKYRELSSVTESESETESGSSAYDEFVAQKEAEQKDVPNDIEIISYAQTVLKDYYPKCELPSGVKEYEIVNTALRYKIEGEIHRTKESVLEEFVMIIEFEDESYKAYSLVSLQIGSETIYE